MVYAWNWRKQRREESGFGDSVDNDQVRQSTTQNQRGSKSVTECWTTVQTEHCILNTSNKEKRTQHFTDK